MTNFYYRLVLRTLIEGLAAFGIECSLDQAIKLVDHLELVVEKNEVINLTRITSPLEAVRLHIIDSLLLLTTGLFDDTAHTFLDIGTGAGYPGIPLAIMSGCHGTLIDSVGKKIVAVNEFIDELGLKDQLRATAIRAEELAKTEPNNYDIVVARAVAQTNTLIEYAAPLLKPGGHLLVCKANPSEDELACAQRAAKLCGMSNVSRETFELPDDYGHREILVYQRTGNPSIKLPRRVGMAQHEPLGIA